MGSRTEKFFTWVWRLNGLLLLAIALLGLLGFFLLTSDATRPAWEDKEQTVTEVAGANLVADDLKLEGFTRIHGTDSIVSDLVSPRATTGIGSSSSYRTDTRNLLFFNAKSKDARWLFDSNHQYLVRHWSIPNKPADDYGRDYQKDVRVVALLMTVSDAPIEDANNDQRQMLLVSADGKQKQSISEPIDELVGQHHVDESSYLIFYARQGTLRVLDLDPSTLEVRSDSVLEVTM